MERSGLTLEDMESLMKIVIQCCKGKHKEAGTFKNGVGEEVIFVAHPERCAQSVPPSCKCRPDDEMGFGPGTWRDYLVEYNKQGDNPDGLFRAADLYKPAVYRSLVERYDWSEVFILSAGWGLIRADYLIPSYDITFSSQAGPCNRRRRNGVYRDFNQLHDYGVSPNETVYFFGGKDYLSLYYSLTQHILVRKVVYHAQKNPEEHRGYEYIPYPPHTNWHYSCARDLMAGKVNK